MKARAGQKMNKLKRRKQELIELVRKISRTRLKLIYSFGVLVLADDVLSTIEETGGIPIEETTNQFILNVLFLMFIFSFIAELILAGLIERKAKPKIKSKIKSLISEVLVPHWGNFTTIMLALSLINYIPLQAGEVVAPDSLDEYSAVLVTVTYFSERILYLIVFIARKFIDVGRSSALKPWIKRSYKDKISSIRVRYTVGVLTIFVFLTNSNGEGSLDMLNLASSFLTALVVVSIAVGIIHKAKNR